MVLWKRKPVQFVTVPDIDDDDSTEIWHIPQTGEIFLTYEDYLNRIDFYKQRRFICQISGKSGLTFFEALQSELAGAAEVEQAFPEALKGPILRKVQFQTTSRIDVLVDQLYADFKDDFFPGEAVTVTLEDGERLHGVVRDKAQFGSRMNADGSLTMPYTNYTVSLVERPDEEVSVDHRNIFRDRKVLTKMVLRSFIKKTVTREAWNGAPWIVKPDIAEQYKIEQRVPHHLRHDTRLLERKHNQAQKRQSTEVNGFLSASLSPNGPVRLPELKPSSKSHKAKGQESKAKQVVVAGTLPGQWMAVPANVFDFPHGELREQPTPPASIPEPPPPPPPPKYPIEDLQVESKGKIRPKLKYFCRDPPVEVEDKSTLHDKILMKSVGPLLEAWDTLNVYCEIFKLDSFTFDDFVQAMMIASEETSCQLFDEIHCAVLKILVSSEADGGKVQIQLPELDDDEEEEEEEEVQESAPPTPEPETLPPARATRRSLAKLEAEKLAQEAAQAEKETQMIDNTPKHRADDVLAKFDWIKQLQKRAFQEGGWQMIMVGLLHQLSKKDRLKASCDELLEQLVPRDVEPTQETVKQHYDRLDVNYRAQALQIICMLTAETKAMRGYMEECSETMTGYRKEKIEWQRKRKQAIEEMKALNEERKILLPDNMLPSPPLKPVPTNDEDVSMADIDDNTANGSEIIDSEDEVHAGRGLRRAQDRAAERKRKEEAAKAKEEAARAPKQSKQFLKLLKDIQKKEEEIKKCEDEIAIIDNDLRENDCPRTRVLGKDRFWNRYYWFERNGMPYGGLPTSSTAAAKYANGCLWVQGPDDLEREGYIDMIPEWQDEYKAKFNMTVPERKEKEEGPTHVYNAFQWGYFSEPEEIDGLIDWLDQRGFNEAKLKKELNIYRDKIVKNMENRKAYLRDKSADAATPAKATPEVLDVETTPKPSPKKTGKGGKRMSTRGRQSVAATATPDPEPPAFRCLVWQNNMALEDENLGHLHSEPPPAAKPKKQTKKSREFVAAANAAEAAAAAVAMTTRNNKKGKVPSRQGTRYDF